MEKRTAWMAPGVHLGADPEFFTAWTLYDIGPLSKEAVSNLSKLLTVITNRGQPLLAGIELIEGLDISDSLFGEKFTGTHNVWCYKWIASSIGQMTEETLSNESNGKQMITGLGETAQLPSVIITSGPDTNTFFIRHDSF